MHTVEVQQLNAAKPFAAIDLCAAAGGFSLGASSSTCSVWAAFEGCPTAAGTYARAFGSRVQREGDATYVQQRAAGARRLIDSEGGDPWRFGHPVFVQDITEFAVMLEWVHYIEGRIGRRINVVLCSPPCQPFSTSGGKSRINNARKDIAMACVAIAVAIRARIFCLENVRLFAGSPQGKAVIRRLEAAGYAVRAQLVNAHKLGVPQRRQRILLVAVRAERVSRRRLQQVLDAAVDDSRNEMRQRADTTVRDVFGRFDFYHLRIWEPSVPRPPSRMPARVHSADEPAWTLLSGCCVLPPRRYVARAADAAPLRLATVLQPCEIGMLQGFPRSWPWPHTSIYCDCQFCFTSIRPAVGQEIGNAIPPAMGAWCMRMASAAVAFDPLQIAVRAKVHDCNYDGPSCIGSNDGNMGLRATAPSWPSEPPAQVRGTRERHVHFGTVEIIRLQRTLLIDTNGRPKLGLSWTEAAPKEIRSIDPFEAERAATAIRRACGAPTRRARPGKPKRVPLAMRLQLVSDDPSCIGVNNGDAGVCAPSPPALAPPADGNVAWAAQRPECDFERPFCSPSAVDMAFYSPDINYSGGALPDIDDNNAECSPRQTRGGVKSLRTCACRLRRAALLPQKCCRGCVCVSDIDITEPDPFLPQSAEGPVTHASEIRRATRAAQYHEFAYTSVRQDHSRHDLRKHVFEPLQDDRPFAGSPADMVAAYVQPPYEWRSHLPTASSPTARRWRRWLELHRATCGACRRHAAAMLFAILSQFVNGDVDDQDYVPWLRRLREQSARPSPFCYFGFLLDAIKHGFEPLMSGEPPPTNRRNHKPVYDLFASTVQHLDKVEKIGAFSGGVWSKPRFSSPLLTVVREKHMLKAQRLGTVPKGRVAINLKGSKFNEYCVPWPFKYQTCDDVVRMLDPDGKPEHYGKTDLSNHFLMFAAGLILQSFLWFADPRRDPSWHGSGAPSAYWEQYFASAPRRAKWRRYVRIPFGLKVAPAFASAISGEMCRMLRRFGLPKVAMMIDDLFLVGDSADGCKRRMDAAEDLFTFLGFTTNDKREGPCSSAEGLEFVGALIRGEEATIDPERVSASVAFLSAFERAGTCEFEEMRRQMGKLSWYSLLICGGAPHLRALWDAMNAGIDTGTVVCSDDARANIRWWRDASRNGYCGSRLWRGGVPARVRRVKSDGAGSGRWAVFANVNGVIMMSFGQLRGSDLAAQCQVPFFELAAVAEACIEWGSTWSGCFVVFAVDSWPISNCINRMTSPDADLIRLLLIIDEQRRRFRFNVFSVHCTRSRNRLADAGTRCPIDGAPQALRPFLAEEGVLPDDVAASPQRSLTVTPLLNEWRFSVRLGLPDPSRWSSPPCDTTTAR